LFPSKTTFRKQRIIKFVEKLFLDSGEIVMEFSGLFECFFVIEGFVEKCDDGLRFFGMGKISPICGKIPRPRVSLEKYIKLNEHKI
jgi:hypothetical protein